MEKQNILILIREIAQSLQPALEEYSVREQYAWWILQAITSKKKIELMLAPTMALTNSQKEILNLWIETITKKHMPLAYLIGSVPFGDLEIMVEPPILIPRPETEEWVTKLIVQLKTLRNDQLTILDLCSGSGCIALALAHSFPRAQVYAIDISEQAIALGKKNAAHNKIHNVQFIHSDLFTKLDNTTLFDIIVSNPPYISFDEYQELDPSVITWEDKQALVAADNGTAIIQEIMRTAPDYLKKNSEIAFTPIAQLLLEIGYKQGIIVKNLMESMGWSSVTIHQDLDNKDRVVSGKVLHDRSNQKKP